MNTESQIIRSLTELVADVLAEKRLRLDVDEGQIAAEQEVEFATSTVRAELARLAAKRPFDSWPPIDEDSIVREVIAQVLGLGRLESLLADDDVSDIHVRGCDSVWVKLRDGRRERRRPIADSDEELVALIRRAATRFSRTEKRFDAGTPELNMQLPDGSRLFAVMEV